MTSSVGAPTRSAALTPSSGVRPRWGGIRRVPPVIWFFLLIPLVLELAWVFWPAINSFYISLTKWNGAGVPEFIGLKNFQNLFSDPIFMTALINNVIWVVGFGGLSIVIGLSLAVALNKPRRGVGFYRSAIYLPMVF